MTSTTYMTEEYEVPAVETPETDAPVSEEPVVTEEATTETPEGETVPGEGEAEVTEEVTEEQGFLSVTTPIFSHESILVSTM